MTIWSDDVTVRGAQDLEDLATASWLSETLFAALEIGLFSALGDADLPVAEVAERCGADQAATSRLLRALSALGLVSLHEGSAACTGVSRRFLVPGRPDYLGGSLEYRRSLARSWVMLPDAVRQGGSPIRPDDAEGDQDYRRRVRDYLLAMDDVARHKAELIVDRLDLDGLPPRVLDVAGGAGAIAAAFPRRDPRWRGLVVDLPEVVDQAQAVWDERVAARPEDTAKVRERLEFRGLDLLSDPLPGPENAAQEGHDDGQAGWGVIVASNIVHAYGPDEATGILRAAAKALSDQGLLIVHDFWTNGDGRGPAKSVLFDLHMLINTYEGRTYPWTWARDLLGSWGLATHSLVSLGENPGDEDTALVIAAHDPRALRHVRFGALDRLDAVARELGFARTAALPPEAVVTSTWVKEKCRYGCGGYDKGASCPPRSPGVAEMRDVLSSYRRAILVQGEPPTADFHRLMLALERDAFLRGHQRALAFVAGPCRLCPDCEPDACRNPKEARPSMEASGVDVYATAAAVGWDLRPVCAPDEPVTYIGLLLVD